MTTPRQPGTPLQSGYLPVNGLEMYYEMHGSGSPLVLLHGNLSTINTSFGKVLPSLSATRRVIAVEQQGHGHTADIDRSYGECPPGRGHLSRRRGRSTRPSHDPV